MSRRVKAVPQENKTAFTQEEAHAIGKALHKLYKRTVHHLIEPKFPRIPMDQLWRDFIPEVRWRLMGDAQANMVMPTNSFQFFDFEDTLAINAHVDMEVTTRLMLPARDGSDLSFPLAYHHFVGDVYACRRQWMDVWNVFTQLHNLSTRLTAAYHWPCAAALMNLGGEPRSDLSNIKRPGTVPGELSTQLRDTSAFVMRHMMLPPIDRPAGGLYEGDKEVGLAARLVFTENNDVFGTQLWPVND